MVLVDVSVRVKQQASTLSISNGSKRSITTAVSTSGASHTLALLALLP